MNTQMGFPCPFYNVMVESIIVMQIKAYDVSANKGPEQPSLLIFLPKITNLVEDD